MVQQRRNYTKIALIGTAALLFAAIAAVFIMISLVRLGMFGAMPSEDDLHNIRSHEASRVYSSDNVLLGMYFQQDRSNVKYEALPQSAIQALIATEDARFMEHDGVDYHAVARVFVKSLLMGSASSGGGSTISQQLAKNLYGRTQRFGRLSMPVNKIREMLIASKIETIYSKEEILALYLNTVCFGDNVYGLENASLRYFSVSCTKLTLAQSALLIGVLKGNSLYSPILHPSKSLERRNTVLGLMNKNGYISSNECSHASKQPLGLKYRSASQYLKENGYFLQQVRTQSEAIIAQYNAKHNTELDINTSGLTIRTTLDKTLQDIMLAAVNRQLRELQTILSRELRTSSFWSKNSGLISNWAAQNSCTDSGLKEERAMLLPYYESDTVLTMSRRDSLKYALTRLQSAVLAADPRSGGVRVWIGGANFQMQPFDRVLAARQVGSTFKPIVYYTALKDGLSPCKYYKNERAIYRRYDDWSPGNSDDMYEGYYSVRGALAHSVNTVTAEVLFSTSIGNVVRTARSMGITADLPPVPSLSLGTASISLAEMVQAYCSFASVGYSSQLYMIESITDKDGTEIFAHKPAKPVLVLDTASAAEIVAMLQTAVNEGTGKRIRDQYGIRAQVAGKTGTTQNNTDGWFIGFTHKLVMGVWTGADNPAVHFVTTANGQGANTALPIWAMGFKKIERSVLKKKYVCDFPFEFPEYLDCELYRLDKPGVFEYVFGKRPAETRLGARRAERKKRAAQQRSDTAQEQVPKKKFHLFKRNKEAK